MSCNINKCSNENIACVTSKLYKIISLKWNWTMFFVLNWKTRRYENSHIGAPLNLRSLAWSDLLSNSPRGIFDLHKHVKDFIIIVLMMYHKENICMNGTTDNTSWRYLQSLMMKASTPKHRPPILAIRPHSAPIWLRYLVGKSSIASTTLELWRPCME